MKKINIIADNSIPLIDKCLTNQCEIIVTDWTKIDNNALKQNNTDALFIRSTVKANRQLLENTNVKFIATATSGYDHFDINYLEENRIAYFSAAGCNANSVAEYVIYAIIKWIMSKNILLENINIGIIGFGNIGKLVARYSQSLGFHILVNDPPLNDNNFDFPPYVKYADLSEIFEKCDIITNHVPLTNSGKYPTKYLLNRSLFDNLKKGTLFIHPSRGGVVIEADLLDFIDEKQITTVIDVWENEPDFNSQIANSSILATPHIAGYSYNGKLKGTMQVLQHFENFYGIKPNYDILIEEINKYSGKKYISIDNYWEIFRILNDNRDFEGDFQKMLEASKLDKLGRQTFFQEIRKNYPKRYETLSLYNNIF